MDLFQSIFLPLHLLSLLSLSFLTSFLLFPTPTFCSLSNVRSQFPSFYSLIGRVPGDHIVHMALHLTWRNADDLESYATHVSTPGDPLYGKYLKAADIIGRYGPPETDVAAIRDWLTRKGIRVVHVAKSRKFLVAECTASEAELAFSTTLSLYKVHGKTVRAASSLPSIPPSLAKNGVTHIVGLDQGWNLKKKHSKKYFIKDSENKTLRQKNSTNICYFKLVPGGNSSAPECGYRASQLRKAYGVPSRLTGKGQKVAVVTAFSSPFMQNDLNIWARETNQNSTLVTFLSPEYKYSYEEAILNPAPSYEPGWQAEEALDIETIHGIAPDASLFHASAASPSDVDLLAAISAILDYDIASVISNSYGAPLAPISFQPAWQTISQNLPWTQILIQAAAQGVGVYFSTGDDGDESTSSIFGGKPTTEYPASDPWAVAIGGTSLGITDNGTRSFEVYWGSLYKNGSKEFFVSGGGGGISEVYPPPFYQTHGPAMKFLGSYGNGKLGRVVPDVSGNADPLTGYLIGYSTIMLAEGPGDYKNVKYLQPVYGNAVFGGTSLSCPMTAAFVSLTQELTKRRFGFINPLLYSLPSAAFLDIVSPQEPIIALRHGKLLQFGETMSLNSTEGYDDSTGLGVLSPLFWSHKFWESVPNVQ